MDSYGRKIIDFCISIIAGLLPVVSYVLWCKWLIMNAIHYSGRVVISTCIYCREALRGKAKSAEASGQR